VAGAGVILQQSDGFNPAQRKSHSKSPLQILKRSNSHIGREEKGFRYKRMEQRMKIRSREKRGMGSNPIIGTSENAVL